MNSLRPIQPLSQFSCNATKLQISKWLSAHCICMCVYLCALSRCHHRRRRHHRRLKDTDYSFEIYWHNGINGDNRIWMEIKFGFASSKCLSPHASVTLSLSRSLPFIVLSIELWRLHFVCRDVCDCGQSIFYETIIKINPFVNDCTATAQSKCGNNLFKCLKLNNDCIEEQINS